MSNVTLDEWMPLLSREANMRRSSMLLIFVVVSLLFLILAFIWQKKYTSYVQLYVDDSNAVISPILESGAMQSRDQANVAKEELFANDILNEIFDKVGYGAAGMSAAEKERIKIQIVQHTKVINVNNQLLEFQCENKSPRMAFETCSLFAELFLDKTMRSTTAETSEAFDFIIDQVESYRDKLENAEARLESFRSQHPGVTSNTDSNVNARIVELQRDFERTSLQYNELLQRKRALETELSSESSTLARDYKVGQTREQIARLQAEIEVLRLSYTDDYPDIVRLKQQIEDLKQMAENQSSAVASSGNGQAVFNIGGQSYTGSASLSPVYQQLRSDLARTSAEVEAQRARMNQLKVMLDNEIERSAHSSRVERELAELTRDYRINKELFEERLRQQENARLTLALGSEKQGVLYRIHQPATYPVLPTGLRFLHIAIAGIVLASLLPFAYLLLFLKLDPRIRTASAVTDQLQLPLLATVPHVPAPNERVKLSSRPWFIVSLITLICILYVLIYFVKSQMEAVGGVA